MGKFFTSFDEAWSHFLARSEPLEWFFGDFPEDEEFVAQGWLIEPPIEIKARARELQNALADLDWLAHVPDHFLHVWLGGPSTMGSAPDQWSEVDPFEVEFSGINCFHSAVVVQVSGRGFTRLVEGSSLDLSTFLPHMTVAVTREEHDPALLRDILISRRDARLGRSVANEVKLVAFPAARTTLLRPWKVIRTVRLRGVS